ncbi:hypothetical protein OA46_09545 [Enterobacter cloacae]|nr:hypothetical protein OA46_09545 [Enterobacter cloacae]
MPKDHNLNVNYDVFNCNEGVPPEPGLSWNMMTGTWEWDSLNISANSIPDKLPQEIKDALENNICIVCGKKNCPYITQDQGYKQLTDALKKGDKTLATRIFKTKFAQFHNGKEARINETMKKIRSNKAGGGVFCQPRTSYNGPFESRRVIALPAVWSDWVELDSFAGNLKNPHGITINFNPSSNMESSFDIEVRYPEHNQMKTIKSMGPGSVPITITGGGSVVVRVKSHSVPVTVTVDFPK